MTAILLTFFSKYLRTKKKDSNKEKEGGKNW